MALSFFSCNTDFIVLIWLSYSFRQLKSEDCKASTLKKEDEDDEENLEKMLDIFLNFYLYFSFLFPLHRKESERTMKSI